MIPAEALRRKAAYQLTFAQSAIERAKYFYDVAEALDDLKRAADEFTAEHGPDAKLMVMEGD